MDIKNERKLAARASELGNSASLEAFDELVELTCSSSALVRRLAASAIGKLAGIAPSPQAVSTLQSLLADAHPQVRQYAAKALGAFGANTESVLPDLRDIYRNPTEKDNPSSGRHTGPIRRRTHHRRMARKSWYKIQN